MHPIARKRNRPVRKSDFGSHPTQSEKREDMPQHISVSPITDIIRHTHPWLILCAKVVLQISRGHRSAPLHRLCQQPAMELQQLASIRSRSLRKKYHRQPRIHRSLHSLTRLQRRPAMTPLDIHRPRHRRHPSHHRPSRNLGLRHEHTRMQRRKHHNIHIAQVVRNHRSALRKPALHADLNPHPSHRSRTETMQPIRSRLPCLWPLHHQLRTRNHEHPHQPNTAPHRPKKIHQIGSSPLSTLAHHPHRP
jgi:hypothetical protein